MIRRMSAARTLNRRSAAPASNDYSAILSNERWGAAKKQILAKAHFDSTTKENLGIVLENTRAVLANGATMQQNLNFIPKLVFPLVMRMFPALIANQIISTQPLQGPSGR